MKTVQDFFCYTLFKLQIYFFVLRNYNFTIYTVLFLYHIKTLSKKK